MLTDFSVVLAALWWLIEIPIVLFLLRFTLRRWDGWMLAIIEVVGSSMHLDRWTMFFVRLADFARNFGPALLVLVASMFVYHRLGGIESPPEIRLIYIFVFWIAAFRFQLRLVQSVARYFGARAVERANEPADQEDQLEHSDVEEEAPAVDGVSAAELPAHKHLDVIPPAPASELVTRTWRVVSGYIAVVVLLLDLVDLAIGPAVLSGLISRFAWWGALPLAVYLLRAWRGNIVDAYTAHWSEQSPISQMTRRHSQRFYGVAVVAFALVITLARLLGQLTKRRLSDRDTTKRVLSFFFQRRVQAHAAEHGRVLERPHELPKNLSMCFPMGPLAAEDKPLKLRLLEEIKETFAIWQEERVEGSLVLVGGTGMGKSTALTLLEDELGAPVLRCRLDQKYTDPSALIARLAEIFDLGDVTAGHDHDENRACDEPAGERAHRVAAEESAFITHLTAKLVKDKRQVVAIDDCHNLFLRQVGGFDAWEAFTRIVNASADHIFWDSHLQRCGLGLSAQHCRRSVVFSQDRGHSAVEPRRPAPADPEPHAPGRVPHQFHRPARDPARGSQDLRADHSHIPGLLSPASAIFPTAIPGSPVISGCARWCPTRTSGGRGCIFFPRPISRISKSCPTISHLFWPRWSSTRTSPPPSWPWYRTFRQNSANLPCASAASAATCFAARVQAAPR